VVLVGLQMLEQLNETGQDSRIPHIQSGPAPAPSQALSITKDSLEACHVAVNILNELLIYDRIEEGEFHLDRKEVTIGGVLKDATKLFQVQVYIIEHAISALYIYTLKLFLPYVSIF
jgi:hypothetical protein